MINLANKENRMIDKSEDREKALRRAERNLRNAHAKGLMQGILSMLTPDDVVFDCGANVGDVTEPLAKSGAHVHAFEPDPHAFGKLKKRVGNLQNVTLHNAAVGTSAGHIRLMRAINFDDDPNNGSVKSTTTSGGRNINEEEGNGIEVPLISLPEFIDFTLQKYDRIAFIKMDIEGAELELLELMLEKNLFDNVKLTVAETHEGKFKTLRPRFKKLRKDVSTRYPITTVNLEWI
jgi:FkbM family methyltransferase